MPDIIYYPAIFQPEEEGYSVSVPDLPGCVTQGESLNEAVEMTREAIGLMLEGEQELPTPSDPAALSCEQGAFLLVIPFDRAAYRRRSERAVKKTLSIPAWLDEEAKAAHLNLSGVLQEALREKLQIE
jgi:predicted RNase H-like HicB family nuclease